MKMQTVKFELLKIELINNCHECSQIFLKKLLCFLLPNSTNQPYNLITSLHPEAPHLYVLANADEINVTGRERRNY